MARLLRSQIISRPLPKGVAEPRLLGSDPRLQIQVKLGGVLPRTRYSLRQPRSRVAPPKRILLPPAVVPPLLSTLAATRKINLVQRRVLSTLSKPQVVTPAATGAVAVGIRVALVRSPRPRTRSFLTPPAVLQTFSGPQTVSVAQRVIQQRRRVRSDLSAPLFYPTTSAIRVALVRLDMSHRGARSYLAEPTVLTVFAGPQVTLAAVRAREVVVQRAPHSRLSAPFFYPATSRINVRLAGRTRLESQRRATRWDLQPPATLEPESVQLREQTITVVPAARIRRRATHLFLGAPAVLAVFTGAKVSLARATRPITHHFLAPPLGVAAATATQQQQTLTVKLVRIRPPQVRSHLARPIFYPATSEILVALAAARAPRATHSRLQPPATLEPESVELREQTILVTLAGRARIELWRRTGRAHLAPPVFLPAISAIDVTLAGRTRQEVSRRVGRASLRGPTVLQTFLGPLVSLTRFIRRPVHTRLAAPVFMPATSPIEVALALRTRTEATRRAPHSRLYPPTVLRVPAVEQQEDTVRVYLAVKNTRRVTRWLLAPPATLEPESVELREQTILVTLAGRTRMELGRRTGRVRLSPPFFYPATSRVTTTLAYRTRIETSRRAAHSRLAAPIFYPATSELTVLLAGRTRVELLQRAPHYWLKPPVVAAPVAPTRGQQTLTVTLVDWRNDFRRRTLRSRVAPPKVIAARALAQPISVTLARAVRRTLPVSQLGAPATLQTFAGPEVVLTRTVPRRVHSRLNPPTVIRVPSVEQAEDTIRVVLAGRTRVELSRRAPYYRLSAPLFRPATSEIQTTLVRIRPRAVISRLAPPLLAKATSNVLSVLLARRARRRGAVAALRPPTVLAVAPPLHLGPEVTLVAARRAGTYSALAPPTVIRPAAIEDQARVVLTRTRPQPIHSRLAPPAIVQYDIYPGAKVSLARATRGQTRSRLYPPANLQRPPHPVGVTLAPARRPKTSSQLFSPLVVAPRVLPLERTVRVKLAALFTRLALLRRKPHPQLFPIPGGSDVPGVGCLTDHPATDGCLADLLAQTGCLAAVLAAEGCLNDALAEAGCLTDQLHAAGTLTEEAVC